MTDTELLCLRAQLGAMREGQGRRLLSDIVFEIIERLPKKDREEIVRILRARI